MLKTARCIVLSFLNSYRTVLQIWVKRYTNTMDRTCAGLIVIGDEILKARVKDTNSYFACNLLYKCGVKVKKISVISDDLEEIEQEIKQFSRKYTHVITSGGIGFTHDDLTYQGLANAFNDSMHYHPELIEIVRSHFRVENLASSCYKIAYIPTKCSLIFDKKRKLRYPCVTLENVYVFPGSPVFFELSFRTLYKELFLTDKCFARDELYINAREDTFADVLTAVSKELPNVCFGSYPVSNNSHYKAFITIESDNAEETKRAKRKLCKFIDPNVLVDYDHKPHVNSVSKYRKFVSRCEFASVYECTLDRLMNIYQQPEKVAVYFDDSIVSIVLVHLVHLARTLLLVDGKLQTICVSYDKCTVYFQPLVEDIAERYDMDVTTLKGGFSDASKELTSLKPQLRILLFGKKHSAFSEELSHQLTEANALNRLIINYLLEDWTEIQIWTFAKSLYLPCT